MTVVYGKPQISLVLLDPEGGSQKATLVVVVICSPGYKNPQCFLNMQRSATKLCTQWESLCRNHLNLFSKLQSRLVPI